jgi:hypothetical protein
MSNAVFSTRVKAGFVWLKQHIQHVPFTLVMIGLLLLVAWWTHSYIEVLAERWINRFGYAPRDLWFFRWDRLILSALVTSGGSVFWIALGMVAFTSGTAERVTGTRRAALTFWGVHLATLLIQSLVFSLPLHQLGFSQARALFFSRDVGPSAGYMGSLGLVSARLPKPWRWITFGAVLLFLLVSLFLPPRQGETYVVKLSADLAHLLAFPLGWISSIIGIKRIKSNIK